MICTVDKCFIRQSNGLLIYYHGLVTVHCVFGHSLILYTGDTNEVTDQHTNQRDAHLFKFFTQDEVLRLCCKMDFK